MELSAEEIDKVTVLRVRGSLMGGSEGETFRQSLYDAIRKEANRIVVDLSNVDWMNSGGLGMLIAGLTTVRSSGGEMGLANVSERLRHPLKITRLDAVFDIFDSVEDAVARYSEDAS